MELLSETRPKPFPDRERQSRRSVERAQEINRESRVGRLALRLANRAYLGSIWLRHSLGLFTSDTPESPAPKYVVAPKINNPPSYHVENTTSFALNRAPDFVPDFAAYPTPVSEDGTHRIMGAVATGRGDFTRAMNNFLRGAKPEDVLGEVQKRKGRIEVEAELRSKAQHNRDDHLVGQDPLFGEGLDVGIVTVIDPLRPRTAPQADPAAPNYN
jgi:hypothetical protein